MEPRSDRGAVIDAAQTEVKRLDRELDGLVGLALKGGAADSINGTMPGLEQRKKELEIILADAEAPPPPLHPDMGGDYHVHLTKRHTSLRDEAETRRPEATGGDLAGIL